LGRRIRPEDGYRGVYEATARHRDQREGADAGALLFARSIPTDRQGKEECYEQVAKVLEVVVPKANTFGTRQEPRATAGPMAPAPRPALRRR
jgi:hypothetical protein